MKINAEIYEENNNILAKYNMIYGVKVLFH